MQLINRIAGQRSWAIIATGVALVALIALLDYATGPDVSCSIFHLIPVALVVWFSGRRAGLAMSVLAAGAWLIVDLLSTSHSLATGGWNASVRLGFFVVISMLLAGRREAQTGLEQAVRDRTAALEKEVRERLEALSALEGSEARYRSLYAAMSEGLVLHELVCDEAGNPVDYVILDVNPAYEHITGLSKEQAVGRKASELYRAGKPPYLEAYAKVVATGQPFQFETRFEPMAKDFRISVFSPAAGRFATVFEDITDRKRATEAMRDSEARFRVALEDSQIVVFSQDRNLRYVKVYNPQGGFPPADAVGKTDADLLHPEEATRLETMKRQAMESKSSVRQEVRLTVSGGLRYYDLLIEPQIADTGEVAGLTCAAMDVTQREHDKRELVRKNRDLETLLYVTSHDLREPLRAIQSFSNLLIKRHPDGLDEKSLDFLHRIVRGGQRMERLMDDILQLSRARRMSQPQAWATGEMIVQEAIDRLKTKIEITGGKVRVAGAFPRFQVDKTWATHAVYNLIVNALKFTRQGEPPDVEISAYRQQEDGQEETGIIVADRGPGVKQEHTERIFELFQRAVARDVEGTGAGLAIVREVAERHGGRAWVQPRSGGGSEFIITFGKHSIQERQ